MRTESIDAWHSDDSNDDLNNNEFEQDYEFEIDMNAIDEKVGFDNIYNDIVRYIKYKIR